MIPHRVVANQYQVDLGATQDIAQSSIGLSSHCMVGVWDLVVLRFGPAPTLSLERCLMAGTAGKKMLKDGQEARVYESILEAE